MVSVWLYAQRGTFDRPSQEAQVSALLAWIDVGTLVSRQIQMRSWKKLMVGGLQPSAVGIACGLGAALGVAPIPGLQMLVATLLSWLFHLNIPLVLLASNISFGPLLLVWAAIAASVGRWLRTGSTPWETYAAFLAEFADAGESFQAFLAGIGRCLIDWLIGSLVLMPIVGLACGFAGYAVARLVQRARAVPTETPHE